MIKIYLDTCCLNRPFDVQTHDKIRLEAEAIILILYHLESFDWEWISSDVIDYEINQTTDLQKRFRLNLISKYAHKVISLEKEILEIAKKLETNGFQAYDALHIACAEQGGCQVFLTTDEKLVKLGNRFSRELGFKVCNPLDWLKEVIKNETENDIK
ncbi:MAG: PIN domain-containing protein [Candidatus Eremiobacterota bacterium]